MIRHFQASHSFTQSLRIAVASAILGVALLELANYTEVVFPAIQPRLIYLMMMVGLAGLLACSSNLALGRMRLAQIGFTLALVVVNALYMVFMSSGAHGEELSQTAGMRLQYALLGLAIALGSTALSRREIARVCQVCAIIASATLVFDFMVPEFMYPWTTESTVPGRAASFFINANKAAEAVILTSLLAMPVLNRRTAPWLILLAGLGIFATFSRSGMLAWFVLVAVYAGSGLLGRTQLLLAGALPLLLIPASSLLILLGEQQGLDQNSIADITNRLAFLGTGDVADDSAQSREQVMLEGVRLFFSQPVFGAGAGATHVWEFPVAPHNQLVAMAAEYGLLGIGLWLWLVVLIATGGYFDRRWLQWVGVFYVCLFSMMSHTMLDYPYWLLSIQLMAMKFRQERLPCAARRRSDHGAIKPLIGT